MFRVMKLGRYVTVDDGGNLCHVSVDPSIYYKNPDQSFVACIVEMNLAWN